MRLWVAVFTVTMVRACFKTLISTSLTVNRKFEYANSSFTVTENLSRKSVRFSISQCVVAACQCSTLTPSVVTNSPTIVLTTQEKDSCVQEYTCDVSAIKSTLQLYVRFSIRNANVHF